MFDYAITGKAAPVLPGVRGIRAALLASNWKAPAATNNKEVAE